VNRFYFMRDVLVGGVGVEGGRSHSSLQRVIDSVAIEVLKSVSLLHSVGNSISVQVVQASSLSSLQVVGNSVSVSVVQTSLESRETGSLSIRSLSLEAVWDSVSVEVESLRSREHSLRLETRLETGGLIHASLELIGDAISIEIGESSGIGSGGRRSESHVVHGQDSVVNSRGFDDLLVDGEGLLDEDGSVDLLVDDGLNFLDDLVDDGLMDDGGILDGSRHGGGNLSSRKVSGGRSLGQEGRVVLDDGSSSLSRQDGFSDLGGDDFSLSHGLDDFVDIELLSLSLDDGLDLDDFLSLVDLVDDGRLLDALDHGGSLSDIDD